MATNNSSNKSGSTNNQSGAVKLPSNYGSEVRAGDSGRHTDRTTGSNPGTTPPPKK